MFERESYKSFYRVKEEIKSGAASKFSSIFVTEIEKIMTAMETWKVFSINSSALMLYCFYIYIYI